MTRARPIVVSPLAAAVLAALAASSAAAQSCVQEDGSATRCRLVLSQPQTFTIEAGAKLARGPAGQATRVSVDVDGRPCAESPPSRDRRLRAQCRLALDAAEHAIEARLDPPSPLAQGVGVRLEPSARLADLPRETRDLYPPGRRRPWFWPFGF